MRIKLKDPKRVYYDREQGVTLVGDKVFSGIKVTQFIRSQLNAGSLIEVAEPTEEDIARVLAEEKAIVLAEKKAEAIANAKKTEVS